MSVVVAYSLLSFTAIGGGIYGWARYRTPLNPLSIYAFVQTGIFTLLSGIAAYSMQELATYPPQALVQTAMVSLVEFMGTLTAYFIRGSFFVKLFGWVMRLLSLNSCYTAVRFSWLKFLSLVAASVLSFMALAVVGGGGLVWLTDTREAYINYRTGAGPFFAAIQWFLVFALLYYLWSRRPHGMHLWALVMFFAAMAYFTGSKTNILSMFVIGITYYHYKVNPVPLWGYLLLLTVFLFILATLLGRQSSGGSVLLIFSLYFKDYFDTSAQFLWRFDEFGYHYGSAWLSSLWAYLPRGLFPNKPYEYGVTLIHEVFFPGFAELGHTPGLLAWTLAYLDFGVVGVLLYGLAGGLWQRAAYENFLHNRNSIFAFLLMMQFSLWPPLQYTPWSIVLLLSIMLAIFFRIVGHHRPRERLGHLVSGRSV